VRTFHRIAGAILALQLVVWVLTGFLFNLKYRYDEAYEPLKAAPAEGQPAGWVSPADAAAKSGIDPAAVRGVSLLHDNRGYVYVLASGRPEAPELRLASAVDGSPMAPLDAAGAQAALASALKGSKNATNFGAVANATQTTGPSALLGGVETPAWQLALASGQVVTVNAYTAEIAHTGRLNTAIDWTYRFHYMQYTPWRSFNIGLVITFSVLLLTLVGSGLRILIGKRRKRSFGYGTRPRLRF
jgi:hypothetical protein